MHKVSAASALALLVATYLMMSADHRDEWREYQRTADELRAAQLKNQRTEIQTESYKQRREDLQEQRDQAAADLKGKSGEIEALNGKVSELQGGVELLARQTKFKGAERDVARANYDIGVRDNAPAEKLADLKGKFDALQSEVDQLSLNLDVSKRQLQLAQNELAETTADRDAIADELKKHEEDAERIAKVLDNINPEGGLQKFKRWLMLQPIVDGFNSPHGIEQEWLPDLPITYGMATTARFDRCRTCHVNIADFAAGNVPNFPHGEFADDKYPHPYSAHPNPDVYLTATSPHPLPDFGCTICHDGDGSGTSFQNAEHTPDDPAQAEHWHHEFGWHSNHFWEYPMQPDRFVESSCIKCHHSVVELGVNEEYGPTAPKVYEGYEIIKTYGCFGCHEINGYDGDEPIGPDLRLEANYASAAKQLLNDPIWESLSAPEAVADVSVIGAQTEQLLEAARTAADDETRRNLIAQANSLSLSALHQMRPLADRLAENPNLPAVRDSLRDLVVADTSLAGAARSLNQRLPEADQNALEAGQYLSPVSWGLSEALKAEGVPGRERKVGPSLRHIAAKSTPEFVAYWTEDPARFRPTTRMPQFFHLTNQHDDLAERFQPVQLAAVAEYLQQKSQPLELMQPKDGYKPDVERGKQAFAERGCLACHSHKGEMFAGSTATFGPDLSKVHEKIKPGAEGFNWLYTWVRDPMQHHARTKMPDLFLQPEGEGDNYVDPAADIAAFLLDGGPGEFPALDVDGEALDDLVELFARKALTQADYDVMVGTETTEATRAFPLDAESIKGDEIELARRPGDPERIDEEEWNRRKMAYVGRRTISFYGCYGCHDIPEFETARPIGTALQDWGRKDTSKLAPEHIEEFLHHHAEGGHGEEHGQSLTDRLARVVTAETNNPGQESETDLAAAFFYESLIHHGRPGFLWQKLRQPRSYDYKKIETKGYDERLRMPKFPFTDEQIEAVATFVLGLVADPPPAEYLYQPEGRAADVIEGERLLDKYNCGGCHVIDLPEVAFGTSIDDLLESQLGPADYQQGVDLLLRLKPPRDGLDRTPAGEPVTLPGGDNVVRFRGLLFAEPDFEEDPEYQEYSFDLWETLQVGDKTLYPSSKMLVPASKLVEHKPARGGDFANWLVPHLMETQTEGNRFLAWQASPPPLYEEGIKVQTPWLFEFLKNPDQLRYTTVLRMPKFNMSDDEARALANYFAAADDAAYPYQPLPQQQPPYLDAVQAQFAAAHPDAGDDYLTTSWNLLNAPLCIKCHSVGGNVYKSNDPKKTSADRTWIAWPDVCNRTGSSFGSTSRPGSRPIRRCRPSTPRTRRSWRNSSAGTVRSRPWRRATL